MMGRLWRRPPLKMALCNYRGGCWEMRECCLKTAWGCGVGGEKPLGNTC